MFVDASAMVAILADEPERDALLDTLERSGAATASMLAVFETVAALSRKTAQSVAVSERQVGAFLRIAGITIVPIGQPEGAEAIAAFARFGKGQGHPAKLNMGDCFAYACARTQDVPLLFVGNDFPQTDIRPALP